MTDISARDKYLLVTLKNNDWKLPSSLDFKLGLASTYILDLMNEGILSFDNDNLLIADSYDTNYPLLELIIRHFSREDENTMYDWLKVVRDYYPEIRDEVLSRLQNQGTLVIHKSKVFWIFTQVTYELTKPEIIDTLINEVENLKDVDRSNIQILRLITILYSCGFTSDVFTQYKLEKLEEFAQSKRCCCNIIDSIAEIKAEIAHFHVSYYYPLY